VNVAASTLEYYLDNKGATHLYAHLITPLHQEGIQSYMNGFSSKYPDLQIILSGPASKWLGEVPANISILHSISDLIAFAKQCGGLT